MGIQRGPLRSGRAIVAVPFHRCRRVYNVTCPRLALVRQAACVATCFDRKGVTRRCPTRTRSARVHFDAQEVTTDAGATHTPRLTCAAWS